MNRREFFAGAAAMLMAKPVVVHKLHEPLAFNPIYWVNYDPSQPVDCVVRVARFRVRFHRRWERVTLFGPTIYRRTGLTQLIYGVNG